MPTVTVSAADFSRAITAVKSVILGRVAVAILGCVVITCSDGKMRVAATDMNSGVASTVPCDGEAYWALPYDRVAAFVSALPKGKNVTLSGEQLVTLRCGSVSARIPSMSAADFPDLHAARPAPSQRPTFSDGGFVAMMSRLIVCCEERPGMPFTNGVGLNISGTRGRMMATNGYVMARQDFECDAPCEISTIIPASAVTRMASLFEGVSVTVAQTGGLIWVISQNAEFVTKAVDAVMPSFDDATADPSASFAVDADSLSRALAATSRVADGTMPAIIMRVSPRGSFLAAASGEGGLMCVPFDCEPRSEFVITLAADKLKAFITAHGGETIDVVMCRGVGRIDKPHLQCIGANYFGVALPMADKAADVQAAIEMFSQEHIEAVAA